MLTKLLGPAIMLVRVVGVIAIVDLRLLIVFVRMSLSLFELYFLLFFVNFFGCFNFTEFPKLPFQ